MLSRCQRLSRALKLLVFKAQCAAAIPQPQKFAEFSIHTAPLCPEIQWTASFLGIYLCHSSVNFSTKHRNHNHKDITSIVAENQTPICFNSNFKSLNSNRLTLISQKRTGCLNSQAFCSKNHCVQNGKQHLWNVQIELLYLFFFSKYKKLLPDSKAILTYVRFLPEMRTGDWSKNPHSHSYLLPILSTSYVFHYWKTWTICIHRIQITWEAVFYSRHLVWLLLTTEAICFQHVWHFQLCPPAALILLRILVTPRTAAPPAQEVPTAAFSSQRKTQTTS